MLDHARRAQRHDRVTIDDLPNTLGSASYTSAKRAAGYTQDDVSFIKRHYICDCLELLRDLEQH